MAVDAYCIYFIKNISIRLSYPPSPAPLPPHILTVWKGYKMCKITCSRILLNTTLFSLILSKSSLYLCKVDTHSSEKYHTKKSCLIPDYWSLMGSYSEEGAKKSKTDASFIEQ